MGDPGRREAGERGRGQAHAEREPDQPCGQPPVLEVDADDHRREPETECAQAPGEEQKRAVHGLEVSSAMQQWIPVTPPRRIVALGGGGFSRFGRYSKLDDYILSLAQKDHPRVLYLGTAGGDSDAHIVLFYEAFAGRARPSHLKLFGAPNRSEWQGRARSEIGRAHV